MRGHIQERWYAPLVEPVLPTVAAAVKQLDSPTDPWRQPRTGLGGALVIHVAKEFGERRWPRAGRAAVLALEGYNQRVYIGRPAAEERVRWLERDVEWAKRAWQSMLERDDPLMRRVMDRLLGEDADLCDHTMPEAVLFLRAAVAAGVVVGQVPDPVHAALDRHATWLGLSWEASRGALGEEAWHGALAAVRLREPFQEDPGELARTRAAEVLEGLPDRPVVRLFSSVLASRDLARSKEAQHREPRTWAPEFAPAPSGLGPRPTRGEGAFGQFSERWLEPVEGALLTLSESGSQSLGRATAYLLGQGGKRVRPMVTLAAASAAGGSPRRVLPLAAAAEWLHQASLVLDDIIDEATLRRGAPPLHHATSPAFAAGVAAFLFARVLRALGGMHPDIRRHLMRAATTLAMGERLELEHTGDVTLDATTYYKIIEAKTARVFSCAAAIGALGVEAPKRAVDALGRYGRELGLAFQIVDDLLDYTGEQAELGKAPGTDLRASKMTLPLIALRTWLEGDERDRLDAAVREGDDEQLPWIRERLEQHQIPRFCTERAAVHVTRAVASLDDKALNDGALNDGALNDGALNDGALGQREGRAEGREALLDLARAMTARRC